MRVARPRRSRTQRRRASPWTLRAQTPLLRLFAAWAAVVWAVGTTASMVHPLAVLHVVCGEHGDVVEVHRDSGSEAPVAAPTVVADGPHQHDHGCAALLPTVGARPAAPDLQPLRIGALVTSDPLEDPGVPRGPPLSYAPKTSPPLAS